jgi:hypothetical protein
MPKSTKATVTQRVDDITRLLIAGAGLPDIRQFATARGWNVSGRQIRRYVKTAYKRMAEATAQTLSQHLALQLARRQALFATAFKAGDMKTCLEILRDSAKLLGLYPKANPAPVTLTDRSPADNLVLQSISAEERQQFFDKLDKRRADDIIALRQELFGHPEIAEEVRAEAMAWAEADQKPNE